MIRLKTWQTMPAAAKDEYGVPVKTSLSRQVFSSVQVLKASSELGRCVVTSAGSIKIGQPVLMAAWESIQKAPQKTRRLSLYVFIS